MLTNIICLLLREGESGGEVLLARKKVGFGMGKIVGVGGTVEPGETIQHAAVREVEEEIGVQVTQTDLRRAAKLIFYFPAKPEWDRVVYVYLTEKWRGKIGNSREVDPFWVPVDQIPYDEMWQDDPHWLPEVLAGKRVVARFSFADDNETLASVLVKEERDLLWPKLKVLPYFRAFLRSVEASYYQEFDLPHPLLDLGSGDGYFAAQTFDDLPEAGVDLRFDPLRESQRYSQSYNGLAQADGAALPFPDGYFSSAVSNSVLEHVADPEKVLAEVARVLRPGGLFLFTCPNSGYRERLSMPAALNRFGLRRLAGCYTDWFMRVSQTHHADSPQVWQARLEQAGFTLEWSWDYFSPAALRMLEWGHYFGAPCLLPKKLFGRWIIAPARWNLWLTERLVRPYAQTEPHPQGTYTFYLARRQD